MPCSGLGAKGARLCITKHSTQGVQQGISSCGTIKRPSIAAFDISQAMLDVPVKKLQKLGCTHWRVEVADHRSIPVPDQVADIVVSGWSIFYLGKSNITNWESNIDKVISEIKRVLRPHGTIILFETLGIGNATPEPPNILTGHYRRLEEYYGFKHQ